MSLVSRLKIVILAIVFLAACKSQVCAQSAVSFPLATGLTSGLSIVQNVGVSTTTFLGRPFSFWQSNYSQSNEDFCYLGAYQDYPGTPVCPGEIYANVPLVDGVPQATVWNGKLYIAYAARGSHQLVIGSSPDGANWSFAQPTGLFVGVSPAIGVANNQLFIAYQENASAHHLGIAASSDGLNFTNYLSDTYRIGHAPAVTTFNGQLVIAAFCQCDAHYLDVYTSNGASLIPTFATEDQSKTLSNASQPSLTSINNVLILAYMQNGQRYFQTATSYDAIHWTPAVQQNSLTNGWNGLSITTVGSTIYGIYESQNAVSPSGPNQFAYSVFTGSLH